MILERSQNLPFFARPCIALKTACKGTGFCVQGVAFSPQKPVAFRTNQGRGQGLGVAFQLNKAKKRQCTMAFGRNVTFFGLREGLLRNQPLPRGRLSFSPVRPLPCRANIQFCASERPEITKRSEWARGPRYAVLLFSLLQDRTEPKKCYAMCVCVWGGGGVARESRFSR